MTQISLKSIGAGLIVALGLSLASCEKKSTTPVTQVPIKAPVQAAEPPKTDATAPVASSTPAPAPTPAHTPPTGKKSYRFGIIAKSQSNPVFIAARNGAKAAAADFSKDGVTVEALWQTPAEEDAQKQAEFITQLANSGIDGIAVSVTDPKVLSSAIDAAVAKGVPVVCFDSDAPASKRMAIYGMDDGEAGAELARQLVKFMGEKGVVAILSGNQNAPNLQARVRGVRDELAKHKGITLKDTYYENNETAPSMVAKIKGVQTANPDITGWAFVGGWPLYTDKALAGIADKGVTVVSIDTLPLPLAYVKSGEVKALVGQDYFGWGYESVRMLLDYAKDGKKPASPTVRAKVDIVTKDNAESFGKIWQEKWLKN